MDTAVRSGFHQLTVLIALIAVCALAATLGSLFTMAGTDGWYQDLQQPAWNPPPDWLFAPVWTLLYASMAVAAWLVWRKRGWEGARGALTLFGVQLSLNVLWTALFFGLQETGLGSIEIILLWLSILATIVLFWPISRAAALILIPYLAWVTYATALTISIWSMN
jgi:tryptophan-rich sensory protein